MPMFRKKPVAIEARQFTGTNDQEIRDFCPTAIVTHDEKVRMAQSNVDPNPRYLVIPTLEGDHRAGRGDWIIKGVQGEFYPCKPDIFAATYESMQRESECGAYVPGGGCANCGRPEVEHLYK